MRLFCSSFWLEISRVQLTIKVLVVSTVGLASWVIVSALFDIARWAVFRLIYRKTYVPSSWLVLSITGLLTLVGLNRTTIVKAESVSVLENLNDQRTSSDNRSVVPLLTCAVVVAGLLIEIGKHRGRHLAKLELNSKLAHPSSSAVCTEVGLRATSDSFAPVETLVNNDHNQVFVPLGVSNSELVYVDLGKYAVVTVYGDDSTNIDSVFHALITSTIFSTQEKVRVIVVADDCSKLNGFATTNFVLTSDDALSVMQTSPKHTVVFLDNEISNTKLMGLIAAGVAVVCKFKTDLSTTDIQAWESGWRLLPQQIEIMPYCLTKDVAIGITNLFNDVDRTFNDSTRRLRVDRSIQTNWNVMVRTLGPVDVQILDGTVIEFEKSKTKELLAWLTSHRERPTRSAARTALWEADIADATFTNVVSDVRRVLNGTHLIPESEEWLPRTFNDRLPFHDSIISDGEILDQCITRAQELPAERAIFELRKGLELVRDLPFAGTGYLWPDAEGITSQLVLNVITAAAMAGELSLSLGDIEGVFWATSKGLQVLGGHEELISLRMRAHAMQGDLAGVRGEWQSYQRTIKADSKLAQEYSPKLARLYIDLTSRDSESVVH